MKVFLSGSASEKPEAFKIVGSENVSLALLELEQVLSPESADDARNWKDF